MGRAYPKQVDPGTNQLIAMPVSTLLSKTSTAAATQMRSDFDNRVKNHIGHGGSKHMAVDSLQITVIVFLEDFLILLNHLGMVGKYIILYL